MTQFYELPLADGSGRERLSADDLLKRILRAAAPAERPLPVAPPAMSAEQQELYRHHLVPLSGALGYIRDVVLRALGERLLEDPQLVALLKERGVIEAP